MVAAKEKGQSYGGIAQLVIQAPPPSLGQPVFHKLKSDLASALFGVGATCGIEIGDGFSSIEQEGSVFHSQGEGPYGGIRGGLSTGEDIQIKVAFKPTASVLDVARKGRHDPCIVIRALPVLEAMIWLVLADHMLWRRLDNLK